MLNNTMKSFLWRYKICGNHVVTTTLIRHKSKNTCTSRTSKVSGSASIATPKSANKPVPSYRSRVRSWNNHFQPIEGEKGLFHKEIPFGNWRAGAFVNFWPTVPYVPEGFNDVRTLKSEVSGEEYTIGTTDYALTRIAECGGLDSYLLETPEDEIDSQFGVDLKRLLLQIIEAERTLSDPIPTKDALKDALKLEAVLGFKLDVTDQLVHDVLENTNIDWSIDDEFL